MSHDPAGEARMLWEGRHATLAVERDRWRWAAFAALGFAGVALCLAVWSAVMSRYEPVIVTIDSLNQPRAVLPAVAVSDLPDAVVRHEIAVFVSDWRAVSIDRAVMEGRLRRIQAFYETGTPADAKLVAWVRDSDPLRRAETETVDIGVESVIYQGGSSWVAEWTETVRARGTGRVETVARFRASFTVRMKRVTDTALLLQNPLGLQVVDYDLQRVS